MAVIKNKCILCGTPFNGMGHNPYPIKQQGFCCDTCNFTKVIPERIKYARMGQLRGTYDD
jgi:hypothetical protein